MFGHVLKGFAGEISSAAVAALSRDPRVAAIEPDRPVRLAGSVTWGLDRVDQRKSRLNGVYSYVRTGAGVTAYVVDSGIRYSHREFGGRAVFGVDLLGGDGSDCTGHGTHVAGTIGGASYGVAKAVRLVSVRMIDCSGTGTVSDLIAALDWIAVQRSGPAVTNISLVSDTSAALDQAVGALIATGVPVVAAAGNDGADACNVSPARVPGALTIGATDKADTRTSFSNFGNCVDWFAPGMYITSASNNSDTESAVLSGTSMATPHTTGAAALYLEENPTASPGEVEAGLRARLTAGVVARANSPHPDLIYTLPVTQNGKKRS